MGGWIGGGYIALMFNREERHLGSYFVSLLVFLHVDGMCSIYCVLNDPSNLVKSEDCWCIAVYR